ncbi:putative mismatch repair protein [Neospora caninum Liverpool]|uniref:Putative mismatch repair protein n=1 Tax=Neospora caninum (strain Liverpool) TaxID=572307 RepID=F0VPT2_NEOCL|nr:putative mismatch repair protein [Neospora caninum Liverpool]CBZ55729.1 putative mismatch repair protein [Neospora caninum Liverpool]|eukprot:XP_003885755.1 putative mismatch repair protein [Neospora caninum Liverpool]
MEVNARFPMALFRRQDRYRQGRACAITGASLSPAALCSIGKARLHVSTNLPQQVAKRGNNCSARATRKRGSSDLFSPPALAAGKLPAYHSRLSFLASSRGLPFCVHPDPCSASPTVQFPLQGKLKFLAKTPPHFSSNAIRLPQQFVHTHERPGVQTRDNLLAPMPSRRPAEGNGSASRSYAESGRSPSVGDFFEAYGLDAVLLVEYCGLNPMGGKAKAGCPKQNLQQTLDCLTSEGFSVSVFEEFASPVAATPIAPGGNRKLRLLTQIVSPSSPLYLPAHMPLYEGEIGAHTQDSQPVFSLYYSPSAGYACGEIDVPQRTLRVEGGLTAEGVEMRIASATGGVPRAELYVHQMSALGARDGTTRLARRLFPSLQKIYLRSSVNTLILAHVVQVRSFCGLLRLAVCGIQDYSSPSAFHRAVLRHLTASLQVPHSEFTIRSHLDYFSPAAAIPEPAASPSDLGVISPSDVPSSQPASPSTRHSTGFPQCKESAPAAGPPRAVFGAPTDTHQDAARQATAAALESFPDTNQSASLAKAHRHRPHPLYVSTASQLGLLKPSGRQGNTVASTSSFLVPPLHLAALPPGAPVTATRRLSSTFMKHFSDSTSTAAREAANVSGESGDRRDSPPRKSAMQSVASDRDLPGAPRPPRPAHSSVEAGASVFGSEANPAYGDEFPREGPELGQARRAERPAAHAACDGGDAPVLLVPSVRVMDAGKLVQVISSRSANSRFFLEVLTLLAPTRYCLRRYPPSLLKPLLTVLQHETQQQVSQERFLEGVEKAIALIEQVILLEEEEQEAAAEGAALAAIAAAEHMSRLAAATELHDFQSLQSGDPSAFALSNEDLQRAADATATAAAAARAVEEAAAAREAAAEAAARALATVAGGHATSSSTRGLLPILDDYFRRMERFRGHIQPFCVPYAHAVVAAAVDDLLVAIFEDFAGVASMPPLPAVCALEDFLPGREQASAGQKTLLTARDVIDLFTATERRQSPKASAPAPSSRVAQLLEKQGKDSLHIPPATLFSSIAALLRQRLAVPAAPRAPTGSGPPGRQIGDAAWPRVLAALQKRLWGDTLNESVYLKKGKPPLEPLKAAGRNGRERRAANGSRFGAQTEISDAVDDPDGSVATDSHAATGFWNDGFEDTARFQHAAALPPEVPSPHAEMTRISPGPESEGEGGNAGREATAEHLQPGKGRSAVDAHWSKTPEHPRDRHGHQIASAWTTPRVAACSRAYTAAKNFAAAAVEKRLRELSQELQPLLPDILLAAHLIIIVQSLSQHSTFAAMRGWQLPRLLNPNSPAELKVDTLTPYYMPRPDMQTLRRQRALQKEQAEALHAQAEALHAQAEALHAHEQTASEAGDSTQERGHRAGGKMFANVPTFPASRGGLPVQVSGETELVAEPSERDDSVREKKPASKDREAVSYSFDMQGLFVLTGENMAGKSTFCRSVLALVVLANAGTTVPRYGAFLASSYMAHDSPLENKSFFFEELSQLHNILSQARSYDGTMPPEKPAPVPTFSRAAFSAGSDPGASLRLAAHDAAPATTPFVIVDEPCKGTAPKWGAGFVGAALELLCRGSTHGVLSTHLHHELSRLPLDLHPNVRFKRMGVRRRQLASSLALPGSAAGMRVLPERPGAHLGELPRPFHALLGSSETSSQSGEPHCDDRVYTYELLDGICRDSNAMQTAWKVGMPPGIISRANELQAHLDVADPTRDRCAIGDSGASAFRENTAVSRSVIKSDASAGKRSPGNAAEKRFPEVHEIANPAALSGVPAAPSAASGHQAASTQEKQATAADTSESPETRARRENAPEHTGAPDGESTACGVALDEAHGILASSERSASVVKAFASSAMALQALLQRLRAALVETTQELTSKHGCGDCGRQEAQSTDPTFRAGARAAERSGASTATRPPPPVLLLPALSARLAAPPPWQDCSACVYVLVAPCSVSRSAQRRAVLANGALAAVPGSPSGGDSGPSGALVDTAAAFCANVYVGETERLETRLRTHSRSTLWAHARVLAVRVRSKAEAREIETALIRRLKEEKGVVLLSLKDGNRRASGLGLGEETAAAYFQEGKEHSDA